VPSMTDMTLVEPWQRRLYLPAYAVAEAARYARTSPQTVAYWLDGRGSDPVVAGKERGKPLSYLQLVEVAIVAAFREAGVTLPKIRAAHTYLAQILEVEHPFARRRLQTEGVHVLMDLREIDQAVELGRLVVADRHGQLTWKALIGDRFAEFDYERDIATVWHVAGRDAAVEIDPRRGFGAPAVRGVPTWAIRGRFRAGESIEDICADFVLERREVEQALAFEGAVAAA